MNLTVDQEKCIGCGACVSLAPDIFQLNPEGKSEVVMQEIPEARYGDAIEAINGCPTGAILDAGEGAEGIVDGDEPMSDPISEEPLMIEDDLQDQDMAA